MGTWDVDLDYKIAMVPASPEHLCDRVYDALQRPGVSNQHVTICVTSNRSAPSASRKRPALYPRQSAVTMRVSAYAETEGLRLAERLVRDAVAEAMPMGIDADLVSFYVTAVEEAATSEGGE